MLRPARMGEPTAFRPTRRSTAAWILYDLANTIFSFNILSLYFPVWLHSDLGLPDSVFAIGNSASMAVILLLSPTLGALSDRARRRIPFLVASTLVCVITTALIGGSHWGFAILFFAIANVAFQGGLIFYDALLAVVSNSENRGRVGALGVGVGYIGSFVGLGLGAAILARDPDADAWVFAATAAAFLLFALPSFFLVREPNRRGERINFATLRAAFSSSFAGLWRLARGHEFPALRRFLLARIFYTDAANTMIIFMSIYAIAEAGYTETSVRLLLVFGIAGAALLAPLWGVLVDRAGAKSTLSVVLLLWMFGLLIVVLIPVLDLPRSVFYPVAFLLGGALGGTWSADRPLMLALSPSERLGEFYGYYAMIGRFAAIFGPLAWALVVDGLDWGRPVAVLTLLGFMVVAFAILRGLEDPNRRGPGFLSAYLPWRDADGAAQPLPARWWLRLPAHFLYAAVTSVLFFAFGGDEGRIPESVREAFVYRIPRLLTNIPQTLLNFLTAEWINYKTVQIVYVLVLLALFGVWFEIREGTRRAVAVFYGTSILSGIIAGLLLLGINHGWDAAWIDRAWNQPWSGGSAGAFGLMGALAARARKPWLLLMIFTVWEINVGAWFLRSYTPAFHLSAMTIGYLWTRHRMVPARPAPSSR